MKRRIKVGSRESKLAVIQTRLMMDAIKRCHPEVELELITMKTTGDKILDRSLEKIGGKGLFVKELDQALMDGRIDLAVHSMKDMPMELPEELPLLGCSSREDPRDGLVLPQGKDNLEYDLPVGCGSKRRTLQLKKLYPGVQVEGIRGNVQTRLSKVDGGQYSATLLAVAGLKRLGLSQRLSRVFSVEEMIPAAGQGILAVQGRKGEDYSFLEGAIDPMALLCGAAERTFVAALEGGCTSPIAAFAQIENGRMVLRGLYCPEDSEDYRVGLVEMPLDEGQQQAVALAKRLKAE
jgi:hydroxymethylbilane synthase